MLSERERANIIDYLRRWTKYDKNYIKELSDNKLYKLYQSVLNRITTYINEIDSYQTKHEDELDVIYSRQQLKKMTYNDLVLLKEKYGLSNKKKEEKIDNSQTTSSIEQNEEKESEFLTYEETFMMYGEDALLFNEKEYQNAGIIIDTTSSKYFKKIEELSELKAQIIKFLLKSKIKNNYGILITRQELNILDLVDLRRIYEKMALKNDMMPSYKEFISESAKKM